MYFILSALSSVRTQSTFITKPHFSWFCSENRLNVLLLSILSPTTQGEGPGHGQRWGNRNPQPHTCSSMWWKSSPPPRLKLVVFLHIHTIQPPHATCRPCWVQVMLLNVCPLQICQLLADKARPFLEGGPCHWINRSLPRETTTDLLKALNTKSTLLWALFFLFSGSIQPMQVPLFVSERSSPWWIIADKYEKWPLRALSASFMHLWKPHGCPRSTTTVQRNPH